MVYKVTDTQLASIADAIRTKGGTSASMAFPDGFMSAISAIPTGSAVLEPLSVSQNGSYTPSAGVDGFSNVVVDVQGGGGSSDNFKIAMGAMSGSVYDTEASVVKKYAFYENDMITGVEMTSALQANQNAFAGCSNLQEASFPEATYLGQGAFDGCINLSKVTASKVTTLGMSTFRNCNNLASISFPLLQKVSQDAFGKCSAISEAILPMLTTISGGGAFNSCTSLAVASFPVLKGIPTTTFYHCIKLESLYLLSDTVVTLANKAAFNETPMSASSYLGYFGSIYVPASLVDAYKSAANWSVYSDRITAYTE